MKVVAHRGYSALYAENSLVAFEQAIAAGADYIEADVRIAADGVPVCWHDPDLARVTDVRTVIADTPAAALTALDLPRSAHMHRLDEVLSFARSKVPVMLDVKVSADSAVVSIMRSIAAAGMTDTVVYGVRTAQQAAALIAAGARFTRLAMPAQPEVLDSFPLTHVIGVRLWEDQVDAANLERIRHRGLSVWVTAGMRGKGEAPGYVDAQRLQSLRRAGIDAVLVNDIALAVSIREE
jgi:glycerophosphoryl diester phosphodiesterase